MITAKHIKIDDKFKNKHKETIRKKEQDINRRETYTENRFNRQCCITFSVNFKAIKDPELVFS